MITVKGYSYAYPDTFGFEDSSPGGEVGGIWRETSRLSKAARIARGGIDDDARDIHTQKMHGIRATMKDACGDVLSMNTSIGYWSHILAD